VMLKLVRFILKTRFSKPLLLFLIVVLIYSILIGLLTRKENEILSSFFTTYIIGVLTLLMIFMIFMGGVTIMKPDLDFLFTLPLKKTEMAVALYLAQFLATGISFIFSIGYILPYEGKNAVNEELIVSGVILLSILVTSISSISHRFRTNQKAGLSAALGAWALLPFVGVNYSFTSLFTGNPLFAVIALLVLDVPLSIVSFRELENAEIGLMKSNTGGSAIFRKTEHFYGCSPVKAIYRKNLNELSLTGRVGLGGSLRVRVSRVSITYPVIVVFFISILYAYLAIREHHFNFVIFFGTLYAGIFSSILLSQEFLSHERAWLGFSSMRADMYWRHICNAKILQSMLILSPLAAADLALSLMRIPYAPGAFIFTLITVPLFTPVSIYINASFNAYQIVDTDMMAGQQNLRQVISLLPVLFVSIMSIISVLSIIFAAITVFVMLAIYYSLTHSEGLAEHLLSRLVEKGYI